MKIFVSTVAVSLSALIFAGFFNRAGCAADEQLFQVDCRSRVPVEEKGGEYAVASERQTWDASQTAIIICDMWDSHWCRGASRRVAELAPVVDSFVDRARARGILIVHAPSDVVHAYEGHPARRRALEAPPAPDLPDGIDKWCSWLNEREKENWPVDPASEGCDCEPQCQAPDGPPWPWHGQIAMIRIDERDAISASGSEIWNLFSQRGIHNVILVGVHTNMCVAGRPFGLRNMARFGKNVVLCRDLTDTMYDSRTRPYVDHFSGTDLVVEHIEKFICPTILSTALTGEPPFRFSEDGRPRVVMLSAESEYQANRTLPRLAHELTVHYDFSCEILQGSTEPRGTVRNHFPDMAALSTADLAVLFARRRALPPEQMQYFRDYLVRGNPLIAFRTSSHAFAVREPVPQELQQWPEFDREVLGCHYDGYPHGETLVRIEAGAEDHAILQGVEGPYRLRETLYRSAPLSQTCRVLLMGSCIDGAGDDPRFRKDPDQEIPDQPVAWINEVHGGRVFYTSLGSGRASFEESWFQRMVVNAVFWALEKPVPEME
jgi:nicotinamidase-related amidase